MTMIGTSQLSIKLTYAHSWFHKIYSVFNIMKPETYRFRELNFNIKMLFRGPCLSDVTIMRFDCWPCT